MSNHSFDHKFVSFMFVAIFVAALAAGIHSVGEGREVQSETQTQPQSKLAIVWTSGDPEVAHRMVLMYAHAAKTNGWFDEVRLIVWGPSSRLLAADKDVQAKIKAMQKDGVHRLRGFLRRHRDAPRLGPRSQRHGKAPQRPRSGSRSACAHVLMPR